MSVADTPDIRLDGVILHEDVEPLAGLDAIDLGHGTDFAEALRALVTEAEAARATTRREAGEDRPLGPKARRTRGRIMSAGIRVFCEQGYAASTVPHVHEAAGVSLGTYYQYFRDKSDLITTIVADAVLASASSMFQRFEPAGGEAAAAEVVAAFVTHYAGSADFQAVWEEVTVLEPVAAEFRRRLSGLLELSLADAIATGQADGGVDTALDPGTTARALTAMVDRTCYLTFVVDRRPAVDAPAVTETLTHLWANALRLRSAGR